MTDHIHAFIILVIMGAVTLATRIIPVLLFGRGDKVPGFILYLGRTMPYTAMGLLIVYCLRDVSLLSGSYALPELISLAAVTLSYLWKRNTIVSVALGTAVYMIRVQRVFG